MFVSTILFIKRINSSHIKGIYGKNP